MRIVLEISVLDATLEDDPEPVGDGGKVWGEGQRG